MRSPRWCWLRFRKRAWLGGVWALALTGLGCAPKPAQPVISQVPTPPKTLQGSAEQLWTAELEEDCAVVFLFEDVPPGATEAEFCEWYRAERPFRIQSFDISRVLTEGEIGWVEVSTETSLLKYPEMAPRKTPTRWQKWRRADGRWRVVPKRESDAYPASPATRDAEAEARLEAYAREGWDARTANDWGHLYELSDPEDRVEVSAEDFSSAYDQIEFLSYELLWVEVLQGTGVGKVRARIEHRLLDPNLTKLPPSTPTISETWVKRGEQWYLDLK
ncbi:MAG: hypothetical protein GY842_11075 [bacterium]|nr:hypothetical protein [bacterium]